MPRGDGTIEIDKRTLAVRDHEIDANTTVKLAEIADRDRARNDRNALARVILGGIAALFAITIGAVIVGLAIAYDRSLTGVGGITAIAVVGLAVVYNREFVFRGFGFHATTGSVKAATVEDPEPPAPPEAP